MCERNDVTNRKPPLEKTVSQMSIELDTDRLLHILAGDVGDADALPEVNITREKLMRMAADLNLTEEEVEIIFSTLDTDGDGVITAVELQEKARSRDPGFVAEWSPQHELPELGYDLDLFTQQWLVGV